MHAVRDSRLVSLSRLGFLPASLALLLAAVPAQSAPGASTNLLPVLVVGAPLLSAASPHVQTAAAVLESAPGILVNSQGSAAAQSDLSIRGSGFSGAGLSLGGVALRNPQTEHFHAELPLPPAMLTRPRALTGLRQTLETEGHLVGSVGFDFPPPENQASLAGGGGKSGWDWQNGVLGRRFSPKGDDRQFGAAAFGGRESIRGMDHPDNDLDRASGGVLLQTVAPGFRANVAGGRQRKTFGARGYYGTSPDLYAEEETDDTLLFVGAAWGDEPVPRLRAGMAWRRFEDDYRLETKPNPFLSRHESTIVSGYLDGSEPVAGCAVRWRISGENEKLDSTTLGNQRRERGALLLLPQWRIGRVRVAAGAHGEVFSDDKPAFLPQGGVTLDVSETLAWYASAAATVHQPSFTELNYESPSSLGNQGLERQEALTTETGVTGTAPCGLRWRAAGFLRRSRHTVDWTQQEAGARWLATDLGSVDTWGAEASVAGAPWEGLNLEAGYGWLRKEHDADVYASRYALDYPRHLLKLVAVQRLCESCRVSASQIFRWQEDNPAREGSSFAALGRIALQWSPPAAQAVEIVIMVENPWNEEFQVLPGQPVGDRRIAAGVAVSW